MVNPLITRDRIGEVGSSDARQGFCPSCLFAEACAGDFDDSSTFSQPAPSNALPAGKYTPTDSAETPGDNETKWRTIVSLLRP